MELQAPDEETMVKVTVADLDDKFGTVGTDRIESIVRRLVHEWLGRARIKTFVGIIAERHARAELANVDSEPEPHRPATAR